MLIVRYPNDVLRRHCAPVADFSEIPYLVKRMVEVMQSYDGIGLAAPQVGVNKRLFVGFLNGPEEEPVAVVNPKLRLGTRFEIGNEGCLSLPDVAVPVSRATGCILTAHTETGEFFQMRLRGFPARIAQHEYDHLNGVLIIDKQQAS